MLQKHELQVGVQPHPIGRVLSVGEQRNRLVCWTDSTQVGGGVIEALMTGQDAPTDARFVGTVLLDGGMFVAHVYVHGEDQ